jgi:hypothetical protein
MAASDPSLRRRVPVQLLDVPVHLRLKAARELAHSCKSQRERDELLDAARDPDHTYFFVTDDALLRDKAA